MEALAAVGLAGNIAQFIDFSCAVLKQTRYVYHSRSAQSQGANDLESISQNFRELSGELTQHRNLPIRGGGLQPQNDGSQDGRKSLRKLAQECQGAANDMLSALQDLKAKNPDSKWSSFRAALASTWNKPRIDALEDRLNSYRSELIVHLQVLENQRGSVFLKLMTELKELSIRSGVDMTHQIYDLRQEVQDVLQTLSRELGKLDAKMNTLSSQPTDAVADLRDDAPQVSTLAKALVESETYGTKMMVSLSILRDLTFRQMSARHSKIHEAHPKTFTAVFEKKIVPWLRSPEQLFWISGKPGSGKSTLMKYIVNNVQTQSQLQHFTGAQKPIIASYFFWINGTEIQRSQEGLLRSLLYEILRNDWKLIEVALPDSWRSVLAMMNSGNNSEYAWSRAELLSAFERLSQAGSTASRLCLFIDGLDEFGGDCDDLIDTIRHLQIMNIKTCVASRPWNVFESAYGQDASRKVYLQDLNKPDIETYVNDKVRSLPEFKSLRVRGADAEQVVNEIVSKSQGVFLWVYLVVRSVREGLRNGDTISLLRKRLAEIPSDLKDFFYHIFKSIESTYRVPTAHGFQVALQGAEPLSPLMYWFLDDMENSPNSALTMPVEGLSDYEDSQRFKQMTLRINGRYKGLLEFTTHKDYRVTVDFLHRTVKDFLMTTEIRRTFNEWQHPDFDPDLAICSVALAELKATVTKDLADVPSARDTVKLARSSAIAAATRLVLLSAKELERKGQLKVSNQYVDELERIGSLAEQHEGPNGLKRAERLPWFQVVGEDFTDAAIQYDLLEFARRRFAALDPPLSPGDVTLYLNRATMMKPHHRSEHRGPTLTPPSLAMAGVILTSGPPMMLIAETQFTLATFLTDNSAEVLDFMNKMCRHVCFATIDNGKFEHDLESALEKVLSRADLEEIRKLNLERQKEVQALVKNTDKKKLSPYPRPQIPPPPSPKPSKREWLKRHLF